MPATLLLEVCTVTELHPALTAHFGAPHAFVTADAPSEPGVYVWSAGGAVLYIGSGRPLCERLSRYRGWLSSHDPLTDWEVSVVHMLKKMDAVVQWVTTRTDDDALLLEARLVEWHRACSGVAPIIVGWDAKPQSRLGQARQWARTLWEQDN